MDQFEDHRKLSTFIFPTYKILISSIIILCGIRWWKKIRDYLKQRSVMIKFAEKLPGPPTLPIIGSALEFLDTENFIFTLTRLSRQLEATTYKLWIGPFLNVVITDPRDIEILVASSRASKKNYLYDLMRIVVNNGLINSFGEVYRSHKKVLLKLINDVPWMKVSMDKFNHHSRIFVKCLEGKIDQPQFDVTQYVHRCIGDIVFESIYGLPERAQLGDVCDLFVLTDIGLHILAKRFFRPWHWYDFIFLQTKIGREFAVLEKKIKTWALFKIEEEWKNIRTNSVNEIENSENLSLFDRIMRHVNKTEKWTNEELRDEYIVLWIGSHDTLTNVTCFMLLMLAMHPEVQEKAREEINKVVGDGNITEAEGVNLKYIEMILKETVRLFPIGPMLGRETTGELKLATCTIPKGCSLLIPIYTLHRNPQYWDEPDKFNPERFSPENSKNRHPYTYIPFSSGLRSCPGQKFSIICLKVVIAHVLRSYRLETTQKLESLRLQAHIATQSLDGYPVKLKKI